MPVLTALAEPPDDSFLDDIDELDQLHTLRNSSAERDLRRIRQNLAEIRRQLLMLEIDADYRRMFPSIRCAPSRRDI